MHKKLGPSATEMLWNAEEMGPSGRPLGNGAHLGRDCGALPELSLYCPTYYHNHVAHVRNSVQ